MTAVDDAVLREDSFLVMLLTRIRSDEGTPLPPGRTMPPSKSQSGQTRRQQPWQDHASKPKPKRSRPGPFFIPRSQHGEAKSGTPLPPDRPISKPKPKWSIPGGSSPARPISKQKPKWSVAGPFFIPRESCSSSPAFVLCRPRRSSSIFGPLFPSFEDLRRFLHLPSLRNESILSPALG